MENLEKFLLILEEVSQSHNYEKLSMITEEDTTQFSDKEKKLYAKLLFMQGKNCLVHDEKKALELFQKAISFDSTSVEVHFEIGLYFLKRGQLRAKSQDFEFAYSSFKECLALDPLHIQASKNLATTSAWLGYYLQNSDYFAEAERALIFIEKSVLAGRGETPFYFYWTWATCYYLSGKFSGEVLDFKQAIEKYRQALKYEKGEPSFWNGYAHTLLAIALLIESQEYLLEAVLYLEKSLALLPNDSQTLFYLGYAYHELFELSGKEELYMKALQAYESSYLLEPHNLELRLHFGNLLVSYGRLWHDQEAIEAAVEKYNEDIEVLNSNPLLLSGQAEALMLLGMYQDDLSLLMKAKEKVVQALDLSFEHADIWGSYARVLFELGKYFQDESYFKQSEQKFNYALSLDNRKAHLWFGLSKTQFALYDLKLDIIAAEHAAESASKAVALRKMLPILWSNWAVCLIQLATATEHHHYLESAIEKLETALSLLDKEEDHFLYLETLYHLGYALDFLADLQLDGAGYQKAIQILSHVVEKEPTYYEARAALAFTMLHLGEFSDDVNILSDALIHFQILIQEDPEDSHLLANYGLLYLNLAYLSKDIGRPEHEEFFFDKAEEKLSLSASLGSASSYYHLACLHSMKGQFEVSMYYIEKCETFEVLPSLDNMLQDDWLEYLKDTEAFLEFIKRLKAKQISDS